MIKFFPSIEWKELVYKTEYYSGKLENALIMGKFQNLICFLPLFDGEVEKTQTPNSYNTSTFIQ